MGPSERLSSGRPVSATAAKNQRLEGCSNALSLLAVRQGMPGYFGRTLSYGWECLHGERRSVPH